MSVSLKILGAACVLWASAAWAEGPKKAAARVPCEADAKRLAQAVQKPASKAEEWQARLKDVRAVTAKVQKAPGCTELFMDARRREGEALQRLGKPDEAKAVYASVISEWSNRKMTAQEQPLGTEAAAHARYLLASLVMQAFDDADLDTTPAELEKSFSARREAFKAGLSAYDEVSAFSWPEWTVSAAVRQAEATERFVQTLKEQALPEGLRQLGYEALARYRSTQDAALPPAEGSLLGAWAAAAGKARDLDVDNDDAQVATSAEEKARGEAEASKPKPVVAAATETKAAPVAKSGEKIGLEVGLKGVALMPAGRAGNVTAAPDLAAVGQRAVVPGGALSLRYRLPFARSLALAAEGGFTRMGGSGTRAFANDPDYPNGLAYRWQLDQVPVLLGLAWELPLEVPLKVSPLAGGAAIYTRSTASYSSDAGALSNSPQEAWALGFYAGVEFALQLGPGSVTVEGRFLSVRTDLGLHRADLGLSKFYSAVNTTPGDVQGSNLLVGYRLSF